MNALRYPRVPQQIHNDAHGLFYFVLYAWFVCCHGLSLNFE